MPRWEIERVREPAVAVNFVGMHSSIVIEGLRIFARHGVLEQERRVGNEFELDIRLDFDASRAMDSDDVNHTVNYARVIDIVNSAMANPANLLEHAAANIRNEILNEFPQITSGKIALYKIHPPLSAQLARTGFILNW